MSKKTIIEAAQNLPPDVPDDRRELVLTKFKVGKIQCLPPERAQYGELLYMMGMSYDGIAQKLNAKHDVIYLSSSWYGWYEKREETRGADESTVISRILKNVLNIMLAGSAAAVEEELSKVATGEIEYEKARFLPKNIKELQNLITMVKEAHQIVDADMARNTPSPVNVMINNHAGVSETEMKQIQHSNERESILNLPREERLKAMLESKKK